MCFSSTDTRRSSDAIDNPPPPPRHRSVTFSDAVKGSTTERQSLGTSAMKSTQRGSDTQHKLNKGNTFVVTSTATATQGDNNAQHRRKRSSKQMRININTQDQNSLPVPGHPRSRRYPNSPCPTKEQLAARSPVSTPGMSCIKYKNKTFAYI
jgi:hypothetical protein